MLTPSLSFDRNTTEPLGNQCREQCGEQCKPLSSTPCDSLTPHRIHNATLTSLDTTGALAGSVDKAMAASFLKLLQCDEGGIGLRYKVGGRSITVPGFTAAYDKHQGHQGVSAKELLSEQKRRTIVCHQADVLADMRATLVDDKGRPVFLLLERQALKVASSLAAASPIETKSWHVILQDSSPGGLTTTFGVHQDTEEDPEVFITVVIRLSSTGTTHMYVEGATEVFEYGTDVGAAVAFFSDLHHRSMPADATQTKIAFFFKKLTSRREVGGKRRREEAEDCRLASWMLE